MAWLNGIDTSAHLGSMYNKGKTIAVIGGGFDYIYPPENEELFYEIINSGGAIVSEYPPATEPNLSTFPRRNRIISGLSLGVLVVEASLKSGSTVTARLANEQNRKLFCLPRNLGITTGKGTNLLIQQGAKLVMNTEDIFLDLKIKEKVIRNNNIKNAFKKKEIKKDIQKKIKVEEEFKDIYEILGDGPLSINQIAKQTNSNIAEVNQKLGFMEIYGYVVSLPGGEYKRK